MNQANTRLMSRYTASLVRTSACFRVYCRKNGTNPQFLMFLKHSNIVYSKACELINTFQPPKTLPTKPSR